VARVGVGVGVGVRVEVGVSVAKLIIKPMVSKSSPIGIAHPFCSGDTSMIPPIFVTNARTIINNPATTRMVGIGVLCIALIKVSITPPNYANFQ
jgi:hypothetical protein